MQPKTWGQQLTNGSIIQYPVPSATLRWKGHIFSLAPRWIKLWVDFNFNTASTLDWIWCSWKWRHKRGVDRWLPPLPYLASCKTWHSIPFLTGKTYHSLLVTLRTLRQAMGPMRNLLPKIQEQVMANHKAGRGDIGSYSKKRRWKGKIFDQATSVMKIWKSCEPGAFRLTNVRTSDWPGLAGGMVLVAQCLHWLLVIGLARMVFGCITMHAQVRRGGDAWVRKEVGSFAVSLWYEVPPCLGGLKGSLD